VFNKFRGAKQITTENPDLIRYTQLLNGFDYLKVPLFDVEGAPIAKGIEEVQAGAK
jgi:hypothetical protein